MLSTSRGAGDAVGDEAGASRFDVGDHGLVVPVAHADSEVDLREHGTPSGRCKPTTEQLLLRPLSASDNTSRNNSSRKKVLTNEVFSCTRHMRILHLEGVDGRECSASPGSHSRDGREASWWRVRWACTIRS